jgi:DNA invertase Pin-like site-specific DNA recombinase
VRLRQRLLTFTAADSPMATLLLSVLGAFAEFERALIRERQLEADLESYRPGGHDGWPGS